MIDPSWMDLASQNTDPISVGPPTPNKYRQIASVLDLCTKVVYVINDQVEISPEHQSIWNKILDIIDGDEMQQDLLSWADELEAHLQQNDC